VKLSPMSGWRRLWIVLSILTGIPTALVGWTEWYTERAFVTAPEELHSLESKAFTKAMGDLALQQNPAMANCAPRTMRANASFDWSYDITCTRPVALAAAIALLLALVPATLMAAVGLTVRWIYRGFRPPKLAPETRSGQPV